MNEGIEMLRHTLATLGYRAAKVFRDAPDGFSVFMIGENTRTPGQILAHMCDLLDWALSQCKGEEIWRDSKPNRWEEDGGRFFTALARLDSFLQSEHPTIGSPDRVFQGAVADALTHIGQIALLRRLAGAPVRGENYSRADIAVGRVGPDQARPRQEFD